MNMRLGQVVAFLAAATAVAGCSNSIAPPVANAGSALTANMGASVVLDGGNSIDPQGRLLSYEWSFTAIPLDSRASFNDAHIVRPSFVPDLDGSYVVQLVVSNGVLASPPNTNTITVVKCGLNPPGIAAPPSATPSNPNTGASVQLSVTVQDADNSPACNLNQTFRYAWSVVARPATSTAVLSDPSAASPTFKPDQIGAYQFSVVVTDSTGLRSDPKYVTFTTKCGAAAIAWDSPSVTATFTDPQGGTAPNVGALATLTAHPIDPGIACAAPGAVSYVWSLESPSGSTAAAFAVSTQPQLSFTPDVVGSYDVSVVATDALGNRSAPASITVSTSTCGRDPVAIQQISPATQAANSRQTVALTATAAATGCPARFDPQIVWDIVAQPFGGRGSLSATSGSTVAFEGFTPGGYEVSAVAINSSGHAGTPAYATIQVSACGSHAPEIVSMGNSPTYPAPRQTVTLRASAADADTSCGQSSSFTFTWRLSSLPQGSQLTFSPGASTFEPDVEGTYTFAVVAQDATGLTSDAAMLNVTVLDPDPTASSFVAVAASGAGYVVADGVDGGTITVAIRNRLGQPIGALPVQIAVSGAANSFTSSGNGSTDANGIFVATLTSTKAEVKTFTATANAPLRPVVLTGHPTLDYVAGPAASILLTSLPPNVTAGATSVVTVTAFDAFANVAKGPNAYTGTIHFASDDPHPAALPADFHFSPATDGTQSFPVTLFTAGSRTVTVTDTARPSFTSSQATTVDSAAAATIQLTGLPLTVTAGVPSNVTVTAFDAFANLAKGPNAYIGTIRFTSTDPAAILPADFAFATGDAGTHAFANGVRLATAGPRTVTVTDVAAPSLTSFQATTVVRPPSILGFTAAPSNVYAGGSSLLAYTFVDGLGSIGGIGPVVSGGSTLAANPATTTYTLTVTNAANSFVTAAETVTVTTPTAWIDLNNPAGATVDTTAAQPVAIAFDPTQPSNAYLATLSQGVLATSTSGSPWTSTGFPALPAFSVSVAHPGGSGLSLWATVNCNGTLYHSTDGTSWAPLTPTGLPAVACAPAPASPPEIRRDPSDPADKTLYLVLNGNGLFHSADDGQTWTPIPLPTGGTPDDKPTKVAISASGIAFVATESNNVFRVAGGSASLLSPLANASAVTALAVDPDATALIVGHADGTTESGRDPMFAFTAGTTPLGNAVHALAFAVDGTAASNALTGSTYAVAGQSVFRSVDFGATFTNVTAGTGAPVGTLEGVVTRPDDGTTVYVLGPGVFSRTYGAP